MKLKERQEQRNLRHMELYFKKTERKRGEKEGGGGGEWEGILTVH